MYNIDHYFEFDNNQKIKKSDKKKQQQQILISILLFGLVYYFMIYLPEEEKKKKLKSQQTTSNKSPEELKEEQEEDAKLKGRIWDLQVYSWADRIVKSKRNSLVRQYQKHASLFADEDRNSDFYFSCSGSYTIYFPPSLREYWERGKEAGKDNCSVLEDEEKLILSEKIEKWIEKVGPDPTRGEPDSERKDNNAIFYGAPGTGKTATMKNICVRANRYPLVEIKGSNLTPTEVDQNTEILPLHKFAYTISELEWTLVETYGFEREESGEVRYILFVDECNQISNNSGFFQPNKLTFLKDCMEGVDKDERSNNLWVFATNHLDQVEEATYREGRLSNPLNFNWNWNEFKKYAEEHNIIGYLPERWKETDALSPEDNQWVTRFNKKLFQKEFLGDDPDHSDRPKFWNLFIENNPNAKHIPNEMQKSDNREENNNEEKKEVEIEIGEFLEYFWNLYDSDSLLSYKGKFDNIRKLTTEKVLDVRLGELIRNTEKQLDNLIDELEISRKDGKISEIMTKIDKIIKSLTNR